MLHAEQPTSMTYDDTTNILTIYYKEKRIELEGCTRDNSAPEFTRKNLFKVQDRMIFNIAGVTQVSFANMLKKGAWCSGKRPKHLRDCMQVSIVELRPWLKTECKSCKYGDRQGSFGHYHLQKSMVAAPLT